ncbi:MAG: Rrf2 family transcriptional regulator [Marinilabiliales bacterium]|nr:MAG: Rrf2 family transcriptional regulator [Marinilabiliales bacterium]
MANILYFTEAASIGIHGMIYIVQNKNKVNILQIAEAIGASKHHVAKVMQKLVKDKYLKSIRGPSGGFILNKEPNKISLYDIYTSIEGEIETEQCPAHNQYCPKNLCIIGRYGTEISRQLVSKMKEDTLDNFIEN